MNAYRLPGSVSASEDTAVIEAGGLVDAVSGDPSASGQLTVHNVNSGENHFQTPASLGRPALASTVIDRIGIPPSCPIGPGKLAELPEREAQADRVGTTSLPRPCGTRYYRSSKGEGLQLES
jgi:hypothetical protein